MLEHLFPQNIMNALNNIRFMHKKGGYMIICVPDINCYTNKYYKSKKDSIIFQPSAGHYIFFSLKSLIFLLDHTGYESHPIYYHDNNKAYYGSNKTFNILEKLKLKQYIERSIKVTSYEVCVLCRRI